MLGSFRGRDPFLHGPFLGPHGGRPVAPPSDHGSLGSQPTYRINVRLLVLMQWREGPSMLAFPLLCNQSFFLELSSPSESPGRFTNHSYELRPKLLDKDCTQLPYTELFKISTELDSTLYLFHRGEQPPEHCLPPLVAPSDLRPIPRVYGLYRQATRLVCSIAAILESILCPDPFPVL